MGQLVAYEEAHAAHLQMWGDNGAGDCTFAAAANWMTLAGVSVNETEAALVREFHRAGGTTLGGLTEPQLADYWQRHGIAGIHARLTPRRQVVPLTIAGLELWPGEEWKVINPASDEGPSWLVGPEGQRGGHMVVVAALGRRGPIVVSWGAVFQMTWDQWRRSNPEVWSVTLR